MKRCNICGTLNQPQAKKCIFCHSEFDPDQIVSRKKKKKPRSTRRKSPMERFALTLLFLALSFLATIPIALEIKDRFERPEPILTLCWLVFFVVLLTVYLILARALRKLLSKRARRSAPPLPAPDAQEQENENREAAHTSHMPKRNSNSAFSAALYDACRHSDYVNLPDYDAAMSCDTACAHLAGGFVKHGHVFDSATTRTLLAAMAARRMLLLCSNDQPELDRAVASLTDLTGESVPVLTLEQSCTTPEHLFTAVGSDQTPLPSAFLSALYVAQMHQRSIRPFLLDVQAPGKLALAMADLKPYLKNATIEGKITVKNTDHSYRGLDLDETVTLPANTRLLLAYRPGISAPMPRDLMDACAFVHLKSDVSESEMLGQAPGALSFDRLCRLCDEAEEHYALSEENWKKIDDLSEKLSSTSFVLDNKLATATERFVGVYMAAGGNEQEALDAVLAAILLPAMLAAHSDNTDENTLSLSQLLDNAFGLENLPACVEMLKKFSVA